MLYWRNNAWGDDMHIRNAHEGETDILTSIGLRAWQKAMHAIGETDVLMESARDAFVHFTRDSWLTITVIEQHGAVCGWAAREALDEAITDFWIDPDSLRQGLGSALLANVEEEMVNQGLETATLQTHSGNSEAIGFFQAHGYDIHWLSLVYSPKLDRELPTVGLSKPLVKEHESTGYGPGI
jgi:ribosomal-protein-alanine N-acetyltransferase